jgi:hypothetical protein
MRLVPPVCERFSIELRPSGTLPKACAYPLSPNVSRNFRGIWAMHGGLSGPVA